MQWMTRKCTTNRSTYVEMWDPLCIQLFVLYILFEFCVQIVYIIFLMYTFCRSELMYTKCIPLFDKLLYTFCIKHLAAIVLLTLYTKCIQKFVEMGDTFCIHQFYTSCTIFVYQIYTRFPCGLWSEDTVMLSIFEFSQVWENVESWLVYENKLFWIAQPCFSADIIKRS